MKNAIQPLSQVPLYAEAAAILDRLTQSHSKAQAEADRTAALMAAWSPTPKDTDAVSAALSMLNSNTSARPGGMAANTAAHTEASNRAEVLRQAITQQKAEMARLAAELSTQQSNECRADHAATVQGIADALKALGAAMQAEADLRGRIEAAGYRCGLTTFQILEIGSTLYPDSVIANTIRAFESYAGDQRDTFSDKPDATIRVHLLTDWPGAGVATEVVSLAGRMARHLVRLGKAEITNDKPRRVAKQQRAFEAVLE